MPKKKKPKQFSCFVSFNNQEQSEEEASVLEK